MMSAALQLTELCLTTEQLDFLFCFYFIVPCGKFGSPYLGKAQQPQEQRYPFLSKCTVFSQVQKMVWLPTFGIFNMCADVIACHCTWELYGHQKTNSV